MTLAWLGQPTRPDPLPQRTLKDTGGVALVPAIGTAFVLAPEVVVTLEVVAATGLVMAVSCAAYTLAEPHLPKGLDFCDFASYVAGKLG